MAVIHKYRQSFMELKGGGYIYYFFKEYPMLAPPVRPSDEEGTQFGLFANESPVVDNPYRSKNYLQGIFYEKKVDNGKHLIFLYNQAEFTLTDSVTCICETRTLKSGLLIEVPKNVYDYQFIKGRPYIIHPNIVQPVT